MEPYLKLSRESSNAPVNATLYRSIIESLRYLVHTRPDISFPMGMVNPFMEAPTTEHLISQAPAQLRYRHAGQRLLLHYHRRRRAFDRLQ